jgi:hypothetical protein
MSQPIRVLGKRKSSRLSAHVQTKDLKQIQANDVVFVDSDTTEVNIVPDSNSSPSPSAAPTSGTTKRRKTHHSHSSEKRTSEKHTAIPDSPAPEDNAESEEDGDATDDEQDSKTTMAAPEEDTKSSVSSSNTAPVTKGKHQDHIGLHALVLTKYICGPGMLFSFFSSTDMY